MVNDPASKSPASADSASDAPAPRGAASGEPASPPCYAHEADDAYMGYASQAEILTDLNELLEAERAGAFVAMASFHLAGADERYVQLMHEVRAGESRWCAMLSSQIERLGGTPSLATGAFREKVLAIPDPLDRLALLNRGQGWVVRKLNQLCPRIRDSELHDALAEMRDAHVEMIAFANTLLPEDRRPQKSPA